MCVMAFESGNEVSAGIFVGAIWTYPIAVGIAAIGKGHKPLFILVPGINILAILVSDLLSRL